MSRPGLGDPVRAIALLAGFLVAAGAIAACGAATTSPSTAASASQLSPMTSSAALSSATASSAAPASPSPASSKESPVLSETPFELHSPAFTDGRTIPRKYTCEGPDVSPALAWSGAPSGTEAFALIVEDPDAADFVHWVAFNLTASATGGLAEAVSESPDAPPQGRNDFGKIGYGGPCPPSGTHRYVFQLYALSAPLELPGIPSAAQVRRAAEGKVLGQAKLTGSYKRGG